MIIFFPSFYFYTKFISNKLIKYKLMLLSIWSILLLKAKKKKNITENVKKVLISISLSRYCYAFMSTCTLSWPAGIHNVSCFYGKVVQRSEVIVKVYLTTFHLQNNNTLIENSPYIHFTELQDTFPKLESSLKI